MPVTIPEAEPTDAISGLLVLQVPPGELWLNVVVAPTQTDGTPEIGVGAEIFTKTELKPIPHELATAYTIATLPPDIPVTRPDDETVAFEASVLYQKPPGMELLSKVVKPIHTDVPPEIEGTAGSDRTFTVVVAWQLAPKE
jgi:hypothetical protein